MSVQQKRCPKCKSPADLHAAFCACGHQFRTDFSARADRTIAVRTALTCSRCGVSNPQPTSFCSRCGTPLLGAVGAATPPQPQALHAEIGSVSDHDTTLSITVSALPGGESVVCLVTSARDGRRREHVLGLSIREFDELKRLLQAADATLGKQRRDLALPSESVRQQ